jgi:hypothetical protein
MTSKAIALRVLDGIFVVFATTLVLFVAGLPMEWVSDLVEMSAPEFRIFSIYVVFAALLMKHAITSSDSAP